jgi:hypothetical protein
MGREGRPRVLSGCRAGGQLWDFETLTEVVEPAVRQHQGSRGVLRHLGAFGLLLLASPTALLSQPLPTPDFLPPYSLRVGANLVLLRGPRHGRLCYRRLHDVRWHVRPVCISTV